MSSEDSDSTSIPVAYTGADGYNRDSQGYRLPTKRMPPIPVRQRKPMKTFVEEYVDNRIAAIRQDRSLLTRDVKNLNRVFYVLRKPMQLYGWEEEGWGDRADGGKGRRKTVIEYIKDVCDERGITRASIGIVTDNVGYMYYKGKQYSVGIDHLKSLMQMGTDVVIIEKQDGALSLMPLAAPYGIALLSTRGFLTENASDLAKLAEDDGANIAILTDNDISGAVIAAKVPQVPRIGIDDQTLEDLGISHKKAELAEEYSPNPSHLTHVKNNPDDFEGLDLEFLAGSGNEKPKRIELNIVMEQVGNERFFEWMLDKLEELFPNRDYSRVIELPEAYLFEPDELDRLDSRVRAHISNTMQPVIDKEEQELSNYQGFIEDTDEYESDVTIEVEDHLNANLDFGLFKKDLQKIIDKWDSRYYFNNNNMGLHQ